MNAHDGSEGRHFYEPVVHPAIALMAVVAAFSSASAATLTWAPGNSVQWDDPANWKNEMGMTGQFPNDGNTDALIRGSSSLILGRDITVHNLSLIPEVSSGFVILDGGGFTLNAIGTTTLENTGTFRNGSFNLSILSIFGMSVDQGSVVTATTTSLGATGGPDGSLLFGGGTFTNAGTFGLLADGSVHSTFSGGTFLNLGDFTKTGGTLTSSVSAAFTDNGTGTIGNSSIGTLFFSGVTALTDSNFSVTGGGLTVLGGISTVADVTVTLANDSEFYFEGGTHSILGSITSSGDATTTFVRARSSAAINGGTFNFAANAPFIVESAFLGTLAKVVNAGAFQWRGGTIRGDGLRNNASTPGLFEITSTQTSASRNLQNGPLENFGHLTVNGGFNIGNLGVLTNKSGATLLVNTGTVSRISSTTTGKIVNLGLLIKDTAGSATVFTGFENDSSATIRITGGPLNLRDAVTLGGSVVIDRTNGDTAQLVIGPSGSTSAAAIREARIDLTDAATTTPLVLITGGAHTLEGLLTLSGSGRVEQTGGTITIPSIAIVDLVTDASSRFRLNGQSVTWNIAGAFANMGLFEWQNGTIAGSSTFANTSLGTLTVLNLGTAAISDGTAGRLENFGRLTVQSGNNLRLRNGGTLVNHAAVSKPLELLGSNSNIVKFDGSTSTELFENEGVLIKDGGGTSTISARYLQTSEAFVESRSGTLLFSGPYQFSGGAFSVQGAASSVRLTGSGTTVSVPIEFGSGAAFEFAMAATPPTHTLTGTISASGSGVGKLTGGTITSTPGNTGRLSFTDANQFQQTGGTLGRDGTIENAGVYVLTAGSTDGSVRNALNATFTQQGGTVDGTFTNKGLYNWSAGAIAGNFLNGEAGLGGMDLIGTTTRTLGADATIENRNFLTHRTSATLSLQTGATVQNNAGAVYELLSAGMILPASGATDTAFVNFGEVRKTGAGTAIIGIPYAQTSSARLSVSTGGLSLLGPATVPGATFNADAGGFLTIQQGTISGVVIHNLNNGSVGYQAAGVLSFAGNLHSVGTGSVRFGGSFNINGDTIFEFRSNAAATIAPNAVAVISAQLLNQGTLNLDGATLFVAGGAGIVNATNCKSKPPSHAEVNIIGSAATFLDSTGSGDAFSNRSDVTLRGTGNLILDRQAKFQNAASFRIASDADVLSGTMASSVYFFNQGMVRKDAPGTSVIAVPFRNYGSGFPGTVMVTEGTLVFSAGIDEFTDGTLQAGTWGAFENGVLILGAETLLRIGASAKVSVADNARITNLPTNTTVVPFRNNGTFGLYAGASMTTGGGFENIGTFELGAGSTLTCSFFDNEGKAIINGTLNFTGASALRNGRLAGNGTVNGNVISATTTAPGSSPGTLSINGSFEQQATGQLEIEIGGLASGTSSDLLGVNGPVTLGGTLEVTLLQGATGLAAGSTFTILTGQSITGTFDSVVVPLGSNGQPLFSVQYFPQSVQLTALAELPSQFALWAQQRGLTAGLNDGFDHDPDHDDRSNLDEFAFDGDPLNSENADKTRIRAVQEEDESTLLSLTLPVRTGATFSGTPSFIAELDRIRYRIRGSTELNFDLATLAVSEGMPPESEGMPVLSAGWEYRTFQATAPPGTGRGFMQADVETLTP